MINVNSLGPEWCIWKSPDILIVTHEDLAPERWALLKRYVETVLKPTEPHWSDWGSPFGFVGVGDDPMKCQHQE